MNSQSALTRRCFLQDCTVRLGAIAATALLQNVMKGQTRPFQLPHETPRAKNVIFLMMGGGPSQLDLLDYKPKLAEMDGRQVPESFVRDEHFAFVNKNSKLMAPLWPFRRRGQCGAEVSDLLPELATVVDDIAIVKSMTTDSVNHGPAAILLATGTERVGNPSLGAWVTYGLGSESADFPAFVVLQSSRAAPASGSTLWSSGFLPNTHAGVPFRSSGEPVLYLANPKGVGPRQQGQVIDTINKLNGERHRQSPDPTIRARISSYEMAFRMQARAPELMDLTTETKETLELYGADPIEPSFARNCLLARRLVERGVRFVQLLHDGWDHHEQIYLDLPPICRETDRGCAALIKDLKRRGLLDQTLIVWAGEFGRTPLREQGEGNAGRDHHKTAFSAWLAGGGIKAGTSVGLTDELGFNVVEDEVHIHDLQATILHLLGLDHEWLTYSHLGREFRLTDVGGRVVEKLLA